MIAHWRWPRTHTQYGYWTTDVYKWMTFAFFLADVFFRTLSFSVCVSAFVVCSFFFDLLLSFRLTVSINWLLLLLPLRLLTMFFSLLSMLPLCDFLSISFRSLFFLSPDMQCFESRTHARQLLLCDRTHDRLISAAIDVSFISIHTHLHAHSLENFRNWLWAEWRGSRHRNTHTRTDGYMSKTFTLLHAHKRTPSKVYIHVRIFGNLIHSKSITKAKPRTHKHEQQQQQQRRRPTTTLTNASLACLLSLSFISFFSCLVGWVFLSINRVVFV